MRKIIPMALLAFLLFFSFEHCQAEKVKTAKIEKGTLIDERFGYKFKVLSNWKADLEKEPSLVRSTLTQKNFAVNKSATLDEEERLIPTLVILADTTTLSLSEIENTLVKGKGEFKSRDEYRKRLETIVSYELINTGDIVLDSIPGKVYGFKKSYLRTVIDPSERYGPSGSDMVTKEDYFLGELIVLKKGNNLYLIQLTGEREFFFVSEKECSKMLETWEFTK